MSPDSIYHILLFDVFIIYNVEGGLLFIVTHLSRACFILLLWPLEIGADEAHRRPRTDLLGHRAAHRARKPQKHKQSS